MGIHYWYMFPVSIIIATIAMASGVGGATFFSPLFILALGLPPEVAIGTGLITEVFGFASGVYSYARRGLVDYRLGLNLLAVTVPLSLVGAWIAGWIAPDILKVILGMGLVFVALSFLRTPEEKEVKIMDSAVEEEFGEGRGETCLTTAGGDTICYTVCNRNEGRFISGIGGLFVGMISTGLGEMNSYFLLQRCRVPGRVSVATSVFVVALTALTAVAGHLAQFAHAGGNTLNTVFNISVFTVPGVVIGAQLGAYASGLIPHRVLMKVLAVLFIIIAFLTLGEVIL